jgi:hypothetical protein
MGAESSVSFPTHVHLGLSLQDHHAIAHAPGVMLVAEADVSF